MARGEPSHARDDGGRSDHRRRCVRGRARLEPERDAHERRLPGAGRLDRSREPPGHDDRVGGPSGRRLQLQSQHPRAAGGLPGQRRGLAHRGIDVQRRRWQHDPLRGALPALSPGGLRGSYARRRRRRLAHRLRTARAVLRDQRPHDGRVRPRRRSRVPAEGGAAPARSARDPRHDAGEGLQPARLALVALRQRHRHPGVGGSCALHQRRHLSRRLPAGRQGQHRRHLLARRDPPRGHAEDAVPGARDHRRRERHGGRRDLLRRGGRRAPADGGGGGPRVQRHRHAAHPPELALATLPRWPREPQRPGGQASDVPSVCDGDRVSSTSPSTATRGRRAAAS